MEQPLLNLELLGYRDELDTGHVKATARVAEFLFHKTTTEGPQCVTAAIFWMKTRGGWREAPQSHEVAVRDVTAMTDEDLIARIRMLDDQLGPMLEANDQDPYRKLLERPRREHS